MSKELGTLQKVFICKVSSSVYISPAVAAEVENYSKSFHYQMGELKVEPIIGQLVWCFFN
jgi:hypothetical protein